MEPQKRVSPSWLKASLDGVDYQEETAVSPVLGLLNGALLGLALAVGAWGAQAAALLPLPLALKYHSFLLASGLLILLCALAGWLTAWLNRTAVTVLLWLGTAVVVTSLVVIESSSLRTLVVWLVDGRFAGLPVYPFADSFSWLLLLSIAPTSLFLLLLFGILALFQEVRLTGIDQERGENGRLNRHAWSSLLLPLPLVLLGGFITANIVADKNWQTLPIVHRAIQTARSYDGDLFALGLREGINYAAAGGVLDQLGGDYRLVLGEIDGQMMTTIVSAEFASGAWINCRLINDQLNYCYDAAPPYTLGLAALFSGAAEIPGCPNCLPDLTPEAQNWLEEHRAQFGPSPIIRRQAQYGGYVLMSVHSAAGSAHADCLFDNPNRPRLLHCHIP
jgi:hypothetical protein